MASAYGRHVIQFSEYLSEVVIIFLLYRWELLFYLRHLCCLWLHLTGFFIPLFNLIFPEVLELIYPDVLFSENTYLRSGGQVTKTSSGAELWASTQLFRPGQELLQDLSSKPLCFPFLYCFLLNHSVAIVLPNYQFSPLRHLPLALAHASGGPLDLDIDPFPNK